MSQKDGAESEEEYQDSGSTSKAVGAGNGSNAQNNPDREDDELSIPRAALNKMIKELTPNIRVANESRELILNCCNEFIKLVSTEANDLCNKQQKKTISHEHVLEALQNLGFGSYQSEARAVVEEAKKVATSKRQKKSRLENLGIPEEELLQMQQQLFAQARMQMEQMEQREWQEMQIKLQEEQQQTPNNVEASVNNSADDDNDYNS